MGTTLGTSYLTSVDNVALRDGQTCSHIFYVRRPRLPPQPIFFRSTHFNSCIRQQSVVLLVLIML